MTALLSTRSAFIVSIVAAGLLLATLAQADTAGVLGQSETAIVRGRVMRQVRSRDYPAANVRVTLTPKAAGARPLLVYTDRDGRFYFRNVRTGAYRLDVWATRTRVAASREVAVKRGQRYVDLDPITI